MVNSNNAIDSKKIYDESYDMDAAVVTRKLNAMDAIILNNSTRGIIKYSLPQHEQDLCSRKGGSIFEIKNYLRLSQLINRFYEKR